MKTTDFLNEIMQLHGLANDNQLHLYMKKKYGGWTRASVGFYRNQQQYPDNTAALAIANELNLRLDYVIGCITAERAERQGKKEIQSTWEKFIKSMTTITTCAIFALLILVGSSYSSNTYAKTQCNPDIHYANRRRRRILARLYNLARFLLLVPFKKKENGGPVSGSNHTSAVIEFNASTSGPEYRRIAPHLAKLRTTAAAVGARIIPIPCRFYTWLGRLPSVAWSDSDTNRRNRTRRTSGPVLVFGSLIQHRQALRIAIGASLIAAALYSQSSLAAPAIDIGIASHHFERSSEYNESNPGICYESDFRAFGVACVYKDSHKLTTGLIGAGGRLTIAKYLHAGAVAFFQFNDDSQNGGLAGVVTLGAQRFAVNLTLTPELDGKHVDQPATLYFQFRFSFGERQR